MPKTQSASMQLLQNAFQVLNLQTVGESADTLSPTAKVRNALELLANTDMNAVAESLPENMREFTTDLFDWNTKDGETSKVTRPLIRAVTDVLNTEGKYAQAVEGIGFAVAATPILDPDSITKLVLESIKVETAYAPERYTLQLSTLFQQSLERYPTPRRLKLLIDLWHAQHDGRWWDMTAGGAVAAQPDEAEQFTNEELVTRFISSSLPCDVHTLAQFATVGEDKRIVRFLDSYLVDFNDGKQVHPDVSVLASVLPWLPVNARPESPTTTLVRALVRWRGLLVDADLADDRAVWPAKPTTFASLFPAVRLTEAGDFNSPHGAVRIDGIPLANTGYRLRLVRNAPQLDANRTYMGNCTWSYKERMKKGDYVLFQIIRDGETEPTYNASATHSQRGWNVGEINSRFNRGDVDAQVRAAFGQIVNVLEPFSDDDAKLVEAGLAARKGTNKKRDLLAVGYRI